MRASAIYDVNDPSLLPGQKRLLQAHFEKGSWHKVAEEIGMNWGYVWNFAIRGKLPRDPAKRRKLLGRKTINEHLASDRISEMPRELLTWALEHRTEM